MDKIALITGAAGGIGRATTDLLRVNGFFVIGIDRLEGDNGADRQLRADLSDQAEVDKVLEEIWSTHKGLDLLVNNAAEQFVQPLIHTQPEDWDRVIDTNLRAAYLLVRGAHDLLSRRTGTIVNVASIHALATSPGMAAYVASKGGLVALTRAMALEFASEGIRVNAVFPGAIDTPMLAASLEREHRDIAGLAARHPLGRVGRPEDVAHAIAFLADSERAAFITGQTLVVDGGAGARLSTE